MQSYTKSVVDIAGYYLEPVRRTKAPEAFNVCFLSGIVAMNESRHHDPQAWSNKIPVGEINTYMEHCNHKEMKFLQSAAALGYTLGAVIHDFCKDPYTEFYNAMKHVSSCLDVYPYAEDVMDSLPLLQERMKKESQSMKKVA